MEDMVNNVLIDDMVKIPLRGHSLTSTCKGGRVGGFGILNLLTVVDARRGGRVYKSKHVQGC